MRASKCTKFWDTNSVTNSSEYTWSHDYCHTLWIHVKCIYMQNGWMASEKRRSAFPVVCKVVLTLKAKISASSNVTGSASDFTTYLLFVSHANRLERDRVKYWDSRRIPTPSPVSSCYESLKSTKIHTTACQRIQFWASCTHFQPSTNFSSIHPSVQQRRLLCLPINCLLRCYSTKILYVFLASPSVLTARTCNLDNFISMTILNDLKISCSSSSRGIPIDSLHLRADASWTRKKNCLFFQFRVRM